MIDFTRRKLIATSAGFTAAGLVGPVNAGEGQPATLYGSVADGKITLPPLHAAAEGGENIANPLPPGKRLGVAIVGIGHLTLEQIIPAFGQTKNVRLAALVSGHRDKALTLAAQHGLPQTHVYDYENFDSIKNNPDVDAVYIVLPNSMHLEFTERAAGAGKHVLCEKPMATSVLEAERMIKVCREANRKLMVAYRLQYDTAHRTMIDMARRKTHGALRFIEAVNGQNDAANGQWRQIKAMAGGGSLPDVGIYCFNAFRYITGEEPIEITARITQPKDDPRFREIEDIATFTLTFPSGVVATGSSGYSFYNNRQLRCMATEGWFGLDPAFAYNGLTMQIGQKATLADSRQTLNWPPKKPICRRDGPFCRRDPRRPRAAYAWRGGFAGSADHRRDLRGSSKRRCREGAAGCGSRLYAGATTERRWINVTTVSQLFRIRMSECSRGAVATTDDGSTNAWFS